MANALRQDHYPPGRLEIQKGKPSKTPLQICDPKNTPPSNRPFLAANLDSPIPVDDSEPNQPNSVDKTPLKGHLKGVATVDQDAFDAGKWIDLDE